MNEQHFGVRLTGEGASFRLWAPAAKRVDLLLEQQSYALTPAKHGWFQIEMPGTKAGARYKFRIDGEIDVPDPASAFQPDDVSGPSEVIDHASYPWRALVVPRKAGLLEGFPGCCGRPSGASLGTTRLRQGWLGARTG